MEKAKYLWLDIETTGLDPTRDRILEIAWFATDDLLKVVGTPSSCIVGAPRIALDRMDTFVRTMHTQNGLLGELAEDAYYSLSDVEIGLTQYIAAFEWVERMPILAGSSVHFDRGFLHHWMPDAEALFHHRHLDVTSLKLCGRDRGVLKPWSASPAHRALDDAFASLKDARVFYRIVQAEGQG